MPHTQGNKPNKTYRNPGVLCFKLIFDSHVSTNIAGRFLDTLIKCVPKYNIYHAIFNRHKGKIFYANPDNLQQIMHNINDIQMQQRFSNLPTGSREHMHLNTNKGYAKRNEGQTVIEEMILIWLTW